MRLTDVRHQERAVAILRRALAVDRMHHAYLFDGPAGVGKELTARGLAALLLCARPGDADACGTCPSCQLFATDNHPDFHLIHRGLHKQHPDRSVRASKGLFLAVDLIRHFLIEPASMKPAHGRRRVFVVRDAERMNEGAQNALLKTLEEPPGSAVLILVTASAARLLPTIRSRCQRIPFELLPIEFVASELAGRTDLSPASAQSLAALSDGRLGVALHWHQIGLLDQLAAVDDALQSRGTHDATAFAEMLVQSATTLGQAVLEDQSDEEEAPTRSRGGKSVPTDALRDALKLVLMLLATRYRDALVAAVGAGDLVRLAPATGGLGLTADPPHADEALAAIHEAERNLDRNVAPQLVLERLAVALAGELSLAR
jgi:DNA polymerase III delta' subunit